MAYEINLLRATINYTGKYHLFHKSLNASFSGFTQTGTNVTLKYSTPISEQEQADIQLADVSFVDSDPLEYIKSNILVPARSFGESLINDFAAENILLGITSSGLTNHVRKTLSETTDCLLTGSLYDAIYEAKAIPAEKKDAVFITNARILGFVNKIEAYLGMPLSNSL